MSGDSIKKVTYPQREKKVRRKPLPDMSEFRAQIKIEGLPLSQTVIDLRTQERY